MRRAELAVENRTELEALLREGAWGTLTLPTGADWPYSVPMNYVYADGVIALHCAPAGRRRELLARDPRVQFTVVLEHAFIPSYFLDPENAAGATQFFRSVMVWGQIRIVEDLGEKARLLTALMARFQPEGRHAAITPENPRYAAVLRQVCLLALAPERMTGKFKFGQNLSQAKVRQLIGLLEARNQAGDAATAGWMRRLSLPADPRPGP